MSGQDFDIVFIADARFPGGTSTALVNEINAAHRAGFTGGLIHVVGPVLRKARQFHPGIRQVVDAGRVQLLDPFVPVSCRLAIVHHPMLFPRPLASPLTIKAEHCILIAHHPAVDNFGIEQYNISNQLRSIEFSTGLTAKVAPVGPNVRASLADRPAELTSSNWPNLIDASAWRRPYKPFGQQIAIGRHSRPDPLKWPDTVEAILAAYPPGPPFRIEILGGAESVVDLLGQVPETWHVHEFGSRDVRDFLHGLDVYVYFHSSQWIEAFGYGVLEALACGLPAILPDSFKPIFKEGALYGQPSDVVPMIRQLARDPGAHRRLRARALDVVKQNYTLAQFPARLKSMFGLVPRRRLLSPLVRESAKPKRRTALFMSSNGVGLGHLTRQMAIARQLADHIIPIFFTLSRAARLAVEAGYLVDHVPFHRYIGTTPNKWNTFLELELALALSFYNPAILIFDGNVPYSGLIKVLQKNRSVRSMWIRRGFWRSDEGALLKRAGQFDYVVEPGDVAESLDGGPTRRLRSSTIVVDPVLMTAPDERLSRRQAQKRLGVDRRRRVVALQLGAGNNFDFSAVRARILDRLLARLDIEVVELRSPIADNSPKMEICRDRLRTLRLYPAYRYSRAFDAAIVAAGYNSFHENLFGAIPTLFLANDAQEMDRQDLRGEYASAAGLALNWGGANMADLDLRIEQLLDPDQQNKMRRRMLELRPPGGAAQIARLIEEAVLAARLATD